MAYFSYQSFEYHQTTVNNPKENDPENHSFDFE